MVLLVDGTSAQYVASAAINLLNNPELASRMGRQAELLLMSGVGTLGHSLYRTFN